MWHTCMIFCYHNCWRGRDTKIWEIFFYFCNSQFRKCLFHHLNQIKAYSLQRNVEYVLWYCRRKIDSKETKRNKEKMYESVIFSYFADSLRNALSIDLTFLQLFSSIAILLSTAYSAYFLKVGTSTAPKKIIEDLCFFEGFLWKFLPWFTVRQ